MVLSNSWWGIQGGFEVDILYVYNEFAEDFVNQLPLVTQQACNAHDTESDVGCYFFVSSSSALC